MTTMDEMAETELDQVLQNQIAYYRARASEYDEWFLRQGRYDRGAEVNARWFAEVERLAAALEAFRPTGRVLELAGGTGLWTQRLARHATSLTVVDASAEVLALNRRRLAAMDPLHTRADAVTYVEADLFAWQPQQQYDVVFFSFWLSHVPPERFASFWVLVLTALDRNGRAFFMDSLYMPESTALDHELTGPGATRVTRRLNNGRQYEIVKVFYEPAGLTDRLTALGWRADIATSGQYMLYGSATPV